MNPAWILAADWGGTAKKRCVFEAAVSERVVRHVKPPADGWTLESLAAEASRRSGPVLIGIDASLGVPASYLAAARRVFRLGRASTFLDLIRSVPDSWFVERRTWSVEQPFIAVPKGAGSLTRITRTALKLDVQLRRALEVQTKAKSTFLVSGIPGTVGSGSRDVWRALRTSSLRVWPFDGELSVLLRGREPVLAECYPRIAYATALLDGPRAPLGIAKTDAAVRRRAVEALAHARWLMRARVRLEDQVEMQASEDAFDAGITAAALLRIVLEGLPPHAPVDRLAEGGILGTGSVQLDLPEQRSDFLRLINDLSR